MSITRLFQKHTAEEIADAVMIPVKLTGKQQKEAGSQLAAHRASRRAAMTGEDKLQYSVLRLKFQLEDYIREDKYNPLFTFGYFLEQYLKLTKRKKKEFAGDIQIHETLLSNILKNRREPNESIMIRLEIHSNNTIPAIDWFKLHEMEKAHQINTNKSLRDKESQYVTHNLQLTV
jgi:transcriptional regulator with XRE-family HTH domain